MDIEKKVYCSSTSKAAVMLLIFTVEIFYSMEIPSKESQLLVCHKNLLQIVAKRLINRFTIAIILSLVSCFANIFGML